MDMDLPNQNAIRNPKLLRNAPSNARPLSFMRGTPIYWKQRGKASTIQHALGSLSPCMLVNRFVP